MAFQHFKSTLDQLLQDGNLGAFFDVLKLNLLPDTEIRRAYTGQRSQFGIQERSRNAGELTKEEFNVNIINIINRVRPLILDELRPEHLIPPPYHYPKEEKESLRFFPELRYKADRFEQATAYKESQDPNGQTHFFYLYGSRRQAPSGLYNRFENEIKGNYFQNKLKLPNAFPSGEIALTPDDTSLEGFKIDLLTKLYDRFQILHHVDADILATDIRFLLKSPLLQGFQSEDCIILYFSLLHNNRLWDGKKMQVLVRWFANDYCRNLPADAPKLYTFLSLKYASASPEVRAEALQLAQESNIVHALPELTPVSIEDVIEWFDVYHELVPKDCDDCEDYIFAELGEAEQYDMRKIYTFLERTIDNFNNKA